MILVTKLQQPLPNKLLLLAELREGENEYVGGAASCAPTSLAWCVERPFVEIHFAINMAKMEEAAAVFRRF